MGFGPLYEVRPIRLVCADSGCRLGGFDELVGLIDKSIEFSRKRGREKYEIGHVEPLGITGVEFAHLGAFGMEVNAVGVLRCVDPPSQSGLSNIQKR